MIALINIISLDVIPVNLEPMFALLPKNFILSNYLSSKDSSLKGRNYKTQRGYSMLNKKINDGWR
jgi:hypothetical protein